MAKYKTTARFMNAIDGKIYEKGSGIELSDTDADYFKQHKLIEVDKPEKAEKKK